MALLKLPAGTLKSGKDGGTVFAKNKGGAYTRTVPNKLSPKTASRQGSKNSLSSMASLWQTLTDTARGGWNTAANNRPYVNRVGTTVTMSGFNLFCSFNTALIASGAAPDLNVPDLTPYPFPSETFASDATGTIYIGANALHELFLDFDSPTFAYSFEVFTSRLMSFGVTSQPNDYKLIAIRDNSTVNSNLATAYNAVFGAVSKGKSPTTTVMGVIFLKIILMTAQGEQSVPYYQRAIIKSLTAP
jgi:hypothetical protein